MHKIYSQLLHNGTRFLNNGGTIIYANNGAIIDVLAGQQLADAQIVDGLLCPGFINAHCHLELSYLQDVIPQKTGLVEFINHINTKRNLFTEEFIHEKIITAEQQMIDNGIVAVGDISNTNYTIAQKQKRNLQYHTFVEVAGVLDSIAANRFADAQQLLQQFAALHNSSIVPHAPYSVSKQLMQHVNNTSTNFPISMHNQECQAEDDLIRNGVGEFIPFLENITKQQFKAIAHNKSSLDYTLPQLHNKQSVLLVHNTFTQKADVINAKKNIAFAIANGNHQQLFWVTCPKANLYIEGKLPEIYNCLAIENQTICIGTDSLASNNCLSVYQEILCMQQQDAVFSTEELLQFATSNGAAALQMPHLGQISKGFTPGILHICNWVLKEEMPIQPIIKRVI